MNQEDFTNTYISMMTGLAEWYNEKEIIWKKYKDTITTIEFVNNSPKKVIVRFRGHTLEECEYKDGKRDGILQITDGSGKILIREIHKDGLLSKIII